MLVYNGTSATNPVHELVLSSSLQWRRLDATTGVAPSIRENPAVTFEPATDRLIVFGGYDPGARKELGDTQVLARDLPTPTQASVASASATHNTAEIFWDVTEIPADIRVESSEGVDRNWLDMGSPSLLARDRLYFKFSGLRPGASRGFRLTWMESGAVRTAGEVWVTPSGAQLLALAMPGVTQSGAIPRGVLTLGESGEAHLEILDISGRRLGQPRRFAPTADAIPVSFDELHASDAGVFWVRVRQGNATVTKRFVRLP